MVPVGFQRAKRDVVKDADIQKEGVAHAQLCGSHGSVGKGGIEPIYHRHRRRSAGGADKEGQLDTGGFDAQGDGGMLSVRQ